MMVLAAMNKVATRDAMEGAEEANAFKDKNYKALHMSTLRKLDMLANFFDRTHANTLKNNGTFREKYGFHWSVFPEIVKAHPLYTGLIVIAGLLTVVLRFTDSWKIVSNLLK